jgi:hypothetical protein
MHDGLRLEPMTVGGILDRAFRLYRANLATFLVVAALVQVPLFLLGLPILRSYTTMIAEMQAELGGTPDPSVLLGYLGEAVKLLTLSFVLQFVAHQLVNGALVKCVSDAYLGREPSSGAAFRSVLPLMPRLLVAAALVMAIVGIGWVFCIVPGVILAFLLCLVSQTIVVERSGPLAAIRRSWRLVSGNLGRAFGLGFLVLGISLAILVLVAGVGQVLSRVVGAGSAARTVIADVLGLVARVAALPIGSAALCLFYYDLRIRKEGFDLEVLARSMGPGPANADET